MKKIYTLALAFMSLGAIAQTTFYTESFETTSGFSYPNGNGVERAHKTFLAELTLPEHHHKRFLHTMGSTVAFLLPEKTLMER